MSHPFLSSDFHIRWSTLTPEHIVPDIEIALAKAKANVDAVADQDRGRMTFQSVVIGLDEATRPLDDAWALVEHLDSLADSAELRTAMAEMLPKVSAFRSGIPLNAHLWDLVETYSKTEPARDLTGVQARCLELSLASFRDAGAELSPEKKTRYEAVQAELAQLTQKFKQNVLDSTNAFELVVVDAAILVGTPARPWAKGSALKPHPSIA
jgi:oligopeptidase A